MTIHSLNSAIRRRRTDRASDRHRSRWAAIGAAVAVTLGAGGFGLASAAIEEGDRPVLVPIEPCRLLDSRPGSQVGPFSSKIGPATSWDISAHGPQENCDIPSDAVALSVNLTGLNATERTFFTLHAADVALPLASNLNLAPGTPPTPNLATVQLDTQGEFSLYNNKGFADAFIDVAGYYVDHNHDDQAPSANGIETDQAVSLNPLALPAAQPILNLAATSVETPRPGTVIVNSTINVASNVPGAYVGCSIGTNAAGLDAEALQQWESPGSNGSTAQLAGTRSFEVDGSSATFVAFLKCQGFPTIAVPGANSVFAFDRALTAIFVPDPVTP